MEFKIDQKNSTVHVKQSYGAPRSDVWDAWTKPEVLDQWWAPHPFVTKTKEMDFKEGGVWLYAMVGPNGEEYWSIFDFISISPKTNFKFMDGFCDDHGNLNPNMPRAKWDIDFMESNGTTTLQI